MSEPRAGDSAASGEMQHQTLVPRTAALVAAAPVSRDSAGPPQRVQAGPRRGKRAGVWGAATHLQALVGCVWGRRDTLTVTSRLRLGGRDTLTGACRLRLGAPRHTYRRL
jgi:hypothetical protein